MIEIRRIAEEEGDQIATLWDQMCQEIPDGGPLTPKGHRNLTRMLGMSAWHQHAFCLVAVDGDTIIGFVNGRLDMLDGLLPGVVGHLESIYVVPAERGQGLTHRLLREAIAWLRARDASVIRTEECIDASHQLWLDLGFEPDMVTLSLYEPDVT